MILFLDVEQDTIATRVGHKIKTKVDISFCKCVLRNVLLCVFHLESQNIFFRKKQKKTKKLPLQFYS